MLDQAIGVEFGSLARDLKQRCGNALIFWVTTCDTNSFSRCTGPHPESGLAKRQGTAFRRPGGATGMEVADLPFRPHQGTP